MMVSAGQPIARLNQDIFNARLTEATAGLNIAGATAEVARAGVDRATFAEEQMRARRRKLPPKPRMKRQRLGKPKLN